MDAKLLKYLGMGRKLESEGIKFYSKALKHAQDANSAKLLQFLIGEEKMHLKGFISLIAGAKKGRAGHRALILKSTLPIFDKKAYSNIKGHKAEVMNIFNTALKMEQESIKLYKKAAAEVSDKGIKAFLAKLADAEKVHHDLIMMHKDTLYNFTHWEGIEQPPIES